MTSKKTPSGAPITKWLVTAASVGTMLGGWVAFSYQPSTYETDITYPTLATSLELRPIPTLVPTPNMPQRTFPNSVTTTNVQTDLPTSLPTLRSVSAPRPKPITVTRSSR